ncbi:MAG: DUF669 domain-containing protein [Isosphaeraceae bacterium]
MAFLGNEFDASQVEPSKPREVIPPNWYTAIVDASDVKPTKKAQEDEQYGGPAANDKLLALTFRVVEGDHKDALIFTNLNIVNVNPQAQEIAQRDLSALCHAVGKLKIKDSSELHNKPLRIKVDVEKKEGFNPRNIIKGYEPAGGAAGTGVASAAVAKPAAQPAWNRK